jgi:hypothetical protein
VPNLLDISTTRDALGGISRSSVYLLIGRQALDVRHIGRRVFVTRESIERVVAHGA